MKRTWSLPGVAVLVSVAACSIITQPDLPPAGPGGGGAGGSGGAGAAGGSGGTGGGGGDVLAEWTAGEPDTSGVYTLPSWLVLESPSTDKTVQIAADRVRTGFGADAARARSVDGTSWGLNVESERTSRVHAARIAPPEWDELSSPDPEAATGPDGAMMAVRLTDGSNNQREGMSGEVTPEQGATITLSAWVTTEDSPALLQCNGCADLHLTIDMGLGWHRASLTTTQAMDQLIGLFPTTDVANQTGSATFDLVSLETGAYPSSVIITSGMPATREAERLYVTSASDVAPGGFFNVTMVIAPNYASGEQAGDHDLLWFDGQNRLYVRGSDSAIVLQAEGMDVAETPALTWARERELTIEVSNLETSGRSLRVTGADGGEATATDPGMGAFPVTGPLHLLGNDMGAQECADLRSITFKRPM